jgi:hypothetical protein
MCIQGGDILKKALTDKLAILLVSILLGVSAQAADAPDLSWISKLVGKSSSDVFSDPRWKELVQKQLPAVKLDLGASKGRVPVADSLSALLSGPPDDVVATQGLVRVSACRQHSCDEKAAVLMDPAAHRMTFALVHYFFGDDHSNEPLLLVASNGSAPAPEQVRAVEAWLTEKGIKPTVRRYLRPSGEVVNLDAPSKETLEGMVGFDWLKPTKAKCEPFKSMGISDPAICWLGTSDTPFGGEAVKGKWYRCKPSSKVEFFVFPSKEACQGQLDTMNANGD